MRIGFWDGGFRRLRKLVSDRRRFIVSEVERTFIAIKPDGVERGLIGQVIERFERRGLKIIGMKLTQLSRETAESHYGEHKGKPFYEGLVAYITSGPIIAMVLEGRNAVS